MVSSYVLIQILNGLVLGVVLILIALGLTLIFGLLGVLNFAHGDLVLLGTYSTWAVVGFTESWVLGITVATVVVAGTGVILERFALQPIYDRDPTLQFLMTFGIAEILREGIQIIWGRRPKSFATPEWGQGTVDLLLFSYPMYRLLLIVFTFSLIFLLYFFLERTDLGLVIRAGSQDRSMVDVLGINVTKAYALTFGLGCALAGLAGGMIGPIRGVYPLLGVELLIPSFVVVIIGGLGSFRGTIIGGLIVGQLIVLTGIGFPSMSRVIIFVAMAVVLLVRPRGLLGKQGMFD